MTVEQIQNQLRETGVYRTPDPAVRSLTDRLFGRFDWWYYLKTMGIVCTGWRQTRRDAYTMPVFSANSYQLLTLVERCGGRVDIQGARNLAEAGPCVIMANHMSMLETFFLPFSSSDFNRLNKRRNGSSCRHQNRRTKILH
jgi:hypothetical protein